MYRISPNCRFWRHRKGRIARLQNGQRQVVADLLALCRYELHMSGDRALGIQIIEEHNPAREVLLQPRPIAHHCKGSEAPRVIEVFLVSSTHGEQLLLQQGYRFSGGGVWCVPRRSRTCREVVGLKGRTVGKVFDGTCSQFISHFPLNRKGPGKDLAASRRCGTWKLPH